MRFLALIALLGCRLPADRPELPATRERLHDRLCRQVCAIYGFRYIQHRHVPKGRIICECCDDAVPTGTGIAYRMRAP